jgi:hypothetical protein
VAQKKWRGYSAEVICQYIEMAAASGIYGEMKMAWRSQYNHENGNEKLFCENIVKREKWRKVAS